MHHRFIMVVESGHITEFKVQFNLFFLYSQNKDLQISFRSNVLQPRLTQWCRSSYTRERPSRLLSPSGLGVPGFDSPSSRRLYLILWQRSFYLYSPTFRCLRTISTGFTPFTRENNRPSFSVDTSFERLWIKVLWCGVLEVFISVET